MSTSYAPPVIPTLLDIRPSQHLSRPALNRRDHATQKMVAWSGKEFLSAIEQTRNLLCSTVGLEAGKVIALSMLNGFEVVTSFLGVTNSRGIAAPLNPAYTIEEATFYLKDMACQALLIEKGRSAPVRQAAVNCQVPIYDVEIRTNGANGPQVTIELAAGQKNVKPAKASGKPQAPNPDDVALILHTSGTTSRPKSVPLTHRNLCRTLTNIAATYRLLPTDVCMVVMPLFHVHGLMACLLTTLVTGGCAIVPEKFSAGTFWQDFRDGGATWYSAVPTIHQILLAREQQHPSKEYRTKLKFIRSCSSALAAPTWHAMEDTFGVPIVEAFAMTEAAHQMTSNDLPPGKRKPGSVGRGQGVEVKILDDNGNEVAQGKEGEICIKGPNVTKGYLNNPQANKGSYTASGFFRTGDQGFLDADQFVYITGRLKELINRGGEKIAPLEVDACMLSHPAVAEAIAFGKPDEKYGQEVAAAIVPKPEYWTKVKDDKEAAKKLMADIQKHVAGKLSPFKVPKEIFFNDQLPKTATGKIQRRNIASFFLAKSQEKPRSKL